MRTQEIRKKVGKRGADEPLGKDSKFDALAHGINAVGADADAVAKVPFEGPRFGVAARSRVLPGRATLALTTGGSRVAPG